MCGIAGYTGRDRAGLIDAMILKVRSRGPDAIGRVKRGNVHLGHSRLSIVDLGETGAQPMERISGRMAVVYNGEIYNYGELREEMEQKGFRFLGHADTELLPFGFAAMGESFFPRLNGMFAFALHDSGDDSVYLVRDRFGIKPLYYSVVDGELVFSSSARAVALHPGVDRSLEVSAIRDFLQFRYVPDGQSFYSGVKILPPGHLLKWRHGEIALRRYVEPAAGDFKTRLERPADWIDAVHEALSRTVERQLRSDVPVGIFLSGGADSAAVYHFACKYLPEPPLAFTFSVGGEHDEIEEARAIVGRYGGRHSVIEIPATSPLDYLLPAVGSMDVPVGDAIIVPTYLLCREAAKERKVVLTGEGADELFGGYVHVPVLRTLDRWRAAAPLLRGLSRAVGVVPPSWLDPLFRYDAKLGILGRDKVSSLLAAAGDGGASLRIATSIFSDGDLLSGTTLPEAAADPVDLSLASLLRHGVETWLPNQILNKMDQLSMAHGLEARVPYLDQDLYSLISKAPEELILGRGRNKILLREVMRREGIPDPERRKRAFHLPVEQRYVEDVLHLAQDWLSDAMLSKHGIVKRGLVDEAKMFLSHGDFIASKQIVTLIVLHMWLEAEGSAYEPGC